MAATVRDFMTASVETLAPDASLQDALRLEMLSKIRHIPIVEGTTLVGLISDRDLRKAMPSVLSSHSREDQETVMRHTKVSQIMTRSPQTISPDAPLLDAVEILCDKKFGALPVVDGDRLVGIISQGDLLKAFRKLLKTWW